MRKLLTALLLLFSAPAFAQTAIYKPATPGIAFPYDGTSRRVTSAFADYTSIIRLVCTTSCFVAFGVSGSNPNATTATGLFLPANNPEYFLTSGQNRMSVIRLNGDGTLYIQEMTK